MVRNRFCKCLFFACFFYSSACHSMDFGFYSSLKKYLESQNLQTSLHILQISKKADMSEVQEALTKAAESGGSVIFRMPVFRDENGRKLKGKQLSKSNLHLAGDFILKILENSKDAVSYTHLTLPTNREV